MISWCLTNLGCGRSLFLAVYQRKGLNVPEVGESRKEGRERAGGGEQEGVMFHRLSLLPWTGFLPSNWGVRELGRLGGHAPARSRRWPSHPPVCHCPPHSPNPGAQAMSKQLA